MVSTVLAQSKYSLPMIPLLELTCISLKWTVKTRLLHLKKKKSINECQASFIQISHKLNAKQRHDR